MNFSALRIVLRCTTTLAAARRSISDDAGNATIELALAFSVLLTPLILCTVGTAFMIYDSIEISNAAHAGAMYGMISSTFASDAAGMQTAAQGEATDFGTNLTVTPTSYYACSAALTGTHYSTQSAAAAACPANASNHYLEFVQVTSSATITPPIEFPGVPKTWTLQGTSVMEVQE